MKTISECLDAYEQKMQMFGYSQRTIAFYSSALRRFLQKAGIKGMRNQKVLASYVLMLESQQKSPQTIGVLLNAVRFFWEEVLKDGPDMQLKAPPRKRLLPVIVSKTQVVELLEKVKKQEYKDVFSLMFQSGLRLEEVLRLEVRDLDWSRMMIIVRGGRGSKERLSLLPTQLRKRMQELTHGKWSHDLVFVGKQGKPIHHRSLQKVFQKAVKEAGLPENTTVHSLRRSFAVQLLADGVDITFVQKVMGHKSPKTTGEQIVEATEE